jgi:Spy/CpxP family protein refolding chaperone
MDNSNSKTKAGILVAVVFVLGVTLGAVGTHYREVGAAPSITKSGYPVHSEVMKRLSQQVGLTAEQQTQVTAIVDDIRTRMHELASQQKPQADAIRAEGRQRIRAVLTPEQLPKFEEFIKQLDADRAKAESQR